MTVSVHVLGILPAKSPQMIVDIRGVMVVALIFDKNLKSRPSLAIAYKIRGSGNSVPKRLYSDNVKVQINKKNILADKSTTL